MERREFLNDLCSVTEEEIQSTNEVREKSVKKMKQLYTEYGDEELATQLIDTIQNNLRSIMNCTKALRGIMKDIQYAQVYDQLPDPGLRFAVISIEELAELSMQIANKAHPQISYDYYNGLQELADVKICMDFIEHIIGVTEPSDFKDEEKAIYIKSKRLLDTFNKEGTYK